MGVTQWIFQRISNVILIVFGLWLLATLIGNGGISQEAIGSLLSSGLARIVLLVVLLIAGLNSVLAGWQIAGDYAVKFGLNETLLMGVIILVSAAYVVVGLMLLF